ncbi:MAG: hypothetical protein AAFP76_06495 [Bacteroidota bacterium]
MGYEVLLSPLIEKENPISIQKSSFALSRERGIIVPLYHILLMQLSILGKILSLSCKSIVLDRGERRITRFACDPKKEILCKHKTLNKLRLLGFVFSSALPSKLGSLLKTQNPQLLLRVSFAEKEGLPSVFPLSHTPYNKAQNRYGDFRAFYFNSFIETAFPTFLKIEKPNI